MFTRHGSRVLVPVEERKKERIQSLRYSPSYLLTVAVVVRWWSVALVQQLQQRLLSPRFLFFFLFFLPLPFPPFLLALYYCRLVSIEKVVIEKVAVVVVVVVVVEAADL